MADQSAPGLPRRPRVDTITFNEDELQALLLDNREVVLPVRAVCGVLGLDADTQAENLRQHDVLAQGLRYVRIPTGGGFKRYSRCTAAISICGWLVFRRTRCAPRSGPN